MASDEKSAHFDWTKIADETGFTPGHRIEDEERMLRR